MVQRVARSGYNPYVTPSNRMKMVKVDGKLYFKRDKKPGSPQKCGDCKEALLGIPHVRPADLRRLKAHERTVNRRHGGTVCPQCVEKRLLKTFLAEEKKQVKETSQ